MIHPGRFDAKIAVVTGAAQGIGQTVAMNLAREGGKVALVDRSELIHEVREKLVYELRDKLPAGGAEILALVADLERYADCCTVMSRARKHFGRIDILINNVGGTIWAKPYEHYEEPQIEAEIRRSLFPTLWCCRAVLPYMLEQSRGTIVNVSSIATRSVNRVPYAAAKGGVNALTASLAFEYSGQGIRVVAAAPGGTEAPQRRNPRGPGARTEQEQHWYQQIVDQTVESTFLKRYATLDEQAAPILFLASDEASYIAGNTLPVGGGDLGLTLGQLSPPRGAMDDHVYRVTEIVGSSSEGVDQAIRHALERAQQTLRNLDWFEVTDIRGNLQAGSNPTIQVTMKVGFRLDEQ